MATLPKYRVLVGFNYPPNKRAEVGDVITDVPDYAVNKLVREGVIVEVTKEDGDK